MRNIFEYIKFSIKFLLGQYQFVTLRLDYFDSAMIDNEQLDCLLKETKLTCMSDIIKFIIQHICKSLNFDPLQELQMRLQQLEKPKGLDRVMIEEVKALVQAMVDQRQNHIYSEVDQQVSIAIARLQDKLNKSQQSKSRKGLSEIDMLQMFNTAQHINQIGKTASSQCYSQSYERSKRLSANIDEQKKYSLQPLMKQLHQIKFQIEKKADRKQIAQFKSSIQKQLTRKVTINETQVIVNRFQQQVFAKLNKNVAQLQRTQYNLKKNINDELLVLKKDFSQALKIKQTKSNLAKLEKKVKTHIDISKDSHQDIQTRIVEIQKQVKLEKKQMFQQIGQICQLVEGLSDVNKVKQAKWIGIGNIKSNCIAWQQQSQNTDKEMFLFQHNKSPIMITKPGYYEVTSTIFGCRKTPSLLLNHQQVAKFDCNKNAADATPSFSFRQVLKIGSSRSTLTIKMDGDGQYNHVILTLKKV